MHRRTFLEVSGLALVSPTLLDNRLPDFPLMLQSKFPPHLGLPEKCRENDSLGEIVLNLKGFEAGSVHLLAACPSLGKTTVALYLAQWLILHRDASVLFISVGTREDDIFAGRIYKGHFSFVGTIDDRDMIHRRIVAPEMKRV